MSRLVRWILTSVCVLLSALDSAAVAQNAPRKDASGDPLPPHAVARIGANRFRHTSAVTALAFAPDGKQLVTIDQTSVRFWDPVTAQLLRHFRALHYNQPTAATYSPDGKWLAVGGWGWLSVYEVATGKRRATCFADELQVRELGFSLDGNTLVAGNGIEVTVCDVAAGKRLLVSKNKLGFELVSAAVPDGKTLLAVTSRNRLSRWRLRDGQLLEQRFGAQRECGEAALSANGKRWAICFPGETPSVHDTVTGKPFPKLQGPFMEVGRLAFSPDCEYLVASSGTHWCAWRVGTGQRLFSGPLVAKKGRAFAVAPGGGVAAYSEDTRVRLFDLTTGKERFEGQYASLLNPQEVFFTTRQSKVVAVTLEKNGKTPGPLRFWDPATGKPLGQWDGPVPSWQHAALSVQGNLFAVFNFHREITLWNVVPEKQVRPFHLKSDNDTIVQPQMAFSPDGRHFASVVGQGDEISDFYTVVVWEVASGKEIGKLVCPTFSQPSCLAFGPDSTTLVVPLAESEKLVFWNPITGCRRTLKGPRRAFPQKITWSLDGRLLAVTNEFASGVLEVATGEMLWANEKAMGLAPTTCHFTRDSRTLLNVHSDEVIAWNAATGKERGRLIGHENRITSLALSPDGRRLLTGSDDHTALVWDVPAVLAANPLPLHPLTDADLQTCWTTLAHRDATKAYRAVDALVAAPAQAASLLAQHVKPVPAFDRENLRQLFAALDNKNFKIRDQARKALIEYGELLVPILEQQLKKPVSLEVRRRLEQLQAQVTPVIPGPEVLRLLRAVAVLEYLDTPAARKQLEALALGAPEARVTQEAQAALRRWH